VLLLLGRIQEKYFFLMTFFIWFSYILIPWLKQCSCQSMLLGAKGAVIGQFLAIVVKWHQRNMYIKCCRTRHLVWKIRKDLSSRSSSRLLSIRWRTRDRRSRWVLLLWKLTLNGIELPSKLLLQLGKRNIIEIWSSIQLFISYYFDVINEHLNVFLWRKNV